MSLSELEAAFRTSLREALCNGIPEATFDRVKERVRGGLNAVLDKEYNIQALSQQLSENVPFIGWMKSAKLLKTLNSRILRPLCTVSPAGKNSPALSTRKRIIYTMRFLIMSVFAVIILVGCKSETSEVPLVTTPDGHQYYFMPILEKG